MSNQAPQAALQYPVVVRQDASGQFTAEAVGLPEIRATCSDRAEAVNRVRLQLSQWFRSGQLIQVEVELAKPALPHKEWIENDPEREAFMEEIRRYREEVDAQFQREEAEQSCSSSSSTPTT